VNILVTGGAGYLGSVLLPKLLVRGHKVRVLDIGYFGTHHLRPLRPSVEVIRDDMRRLRNDRAFCERLLDGCDCVIHLAAVSNDPSAELNPELTLEVNFDATEALAEAAKQRRLRFLFSSSCSVFGEADGELDEDGPINPLTTYAQTKAKAELMLECLADASWSPVILRNGTLFGYSPRMRFDLVVNIFSLCGILYNEVKVLGSGRQWRPFLHVADCARAFVHFAELPEPRHRFYNIAHENLRVLDVVEVFRAIIPGLRVTQVELADPDLRDYRVQAQRMRAEGFAPTTSIQLGAEQMTEALVAGLIPDPESIFYRNAKWLKELSQFGDRSGHKQLIELMETMAAVQPRSEAWVS
jgi:nucleoside-diphosphate-sugar epimerase